MLGIGPARGKEHGRLIDSKLEKETEMNSALAVRAW